MEVEYTATDPKNWVGEWKWTKRFRRMDDTDITEASCLPDLNEHMPSVKAGTQRPLGGKGERFTEKSYFSDRPVCIGMGLAASAYAHHSMNGFDRAKTITITGTVKQFKWANPHSWIEVEVVNDKGAAETWNLEMTAPGILVRAGWKSTMLKPGDKATFRGPPHGEWRYRRPVRFGYFRGRPYDDRARPADGCHARPRQAVSGLILYI